MVLICLYCFNCTKFCLLILRKIIKIVATRCHILRLKCTKFDFGWGSAPDPTGGAYTALSRSPSCIKGALLLRGEGERYGREGDIDGYMLAEEMEAVKFLIPESDTLNKQVDILRHIVTFIGSAEFPNFYIALRTLLTIPITVASGERSFSKLNLIKTYLRSSMAFGAGATQ